MPLRINFGRSRNGRLAARRVIEYTIPHWKTAASGARFVEYRPTTPTYLFHGLVSLCAMASLAAVWWYAGLPWDGRTASRPSAANSSTSLAGDPQAADELQDAMATLESQLSPAQRGELARRDDVRTAEVEAARAQLARQRRLNTAAGDVFHWGAFIVLVPLAVLPLAALPAGRMVIERSANGELLITERGLGTTARSWPAGTFGEIQYGVERETRSSRRAFSRRRRVLGWRWIVRLTADRREWLARGPSIVDDPEVVFYIDYQYRGPIDLSRPTPGVLELIDQLRRLACIERVTCFGGETEETY